MCSHPILYIGLSRSTSVPKQSTKSGSGMYTTTSEPLNSTLSTDTEIELPDTIKHSVLMGYTHYPIDCRVTQQNIIDLKYEAINSNDDAMASMCEMALAGHGGWYEEAETYILCVRREAEYQNRLELYGF